jgi:hypothetical protein
LIRNTDRQPNSLMSRPPMAGPSAGAANSSRPALTGMVRAPPVPLPSSRPIASGTMGAPASPCRTRVAMSTPTVGANAQQADVAMKPASAAW